MYNNHNGSLIRLGEKVIHAGDHSYRYGDGLFETMRVADKEILLEDYHFGRLFSGLETLKFLTQSFFTKQKISEEVKELCKKNNCEKLARIRLSVSRGSGGLFDCDNKFTYLIECRPLEPTGFNKEGLVIDVFPDAKKSIDKFSNLKSANYLPYVMAAIWAKENNLNDALIQNQYGRICDATVANIFWVKVGKVFTPPLIEGCVAGVMRKRILDLSPGVEEKNLTENDLINADEVFLTNVMTGIRWVKQFRDKFYENKISQNLFTHLNQTISL